MRLALISDIHGNLTSFQAVLGGLAGEQVDRIVCLGDVAGFGPQPCETLAQLRRLDCPVVMGNTDAFLLKPVIKPVASESDELIQTVEVWGAGQLTEQDRAFIRTFQPIIALDLGAGFNLLAFHGSPRSYNEIVRATTTEEDLDEIFAGVDAQLLAGGHTHTQLFRRYKDALLLNPGSVGLPHESNRLSGRVRNPPWAEYAIVDVAHGSLAVELRRIRVDVSAIVRAIDESGMPYADRLAADWTIPEPS